MKIVNTTTDPVDLSIVVPVRNEEKYLPHFLRSLEQQRTDLAAEVLVVDDDSDDRTPELARASGCIVLPGETRGDVAAMRNFGLRTARGEAVLFADADVAFSPDFAEKMTRPIIVGEVDATLCWMQQPLETAVRVFPNEYSRSYAFLLQVLPGVLWRKSPVRLLVWLGAWVKSCVRSRQLLSPLGVPDRVHTAMLVVRRGVAEASGGWCGPLGSHQDTQFSWAVFTRTRRVRWCIGPVAYISLRREFPTRWTWMLGPVMRSRTRRGTRPERRSDGAYSDPDGVR